MLNLPDAPDFFSQKPNPSVSRAIALSQMSLPILNARPDAEALRLRGKCHVPFSLFDDPS